MRTVNICGIIKTKTARGVDRPRPPCYGSPVLEKTPMLGIQDYGDDGVVPMIESEDVGPTIESIIDYVEKRFEVLDAENRHGDLLALCQEFHEWGTADEGDELSYYVCPSFE